MIGQESRGLRDEMRDKLRVTLVVRGGTMNKGSVKEAEKAACFQLIIILDGLKLNCSLGFWRFKGVNLSLRL